MGLSKVDIVERIYKEAGFTKKDASQLVDLLFATIKTTLAKGESVKIAGFGNFSLTNKTSRMGRNPQTGEPLEITPRRVLTFKASLTLKEDITERYAHRINDDGSEDQTIPAKPKILRAANLFAQNTEEEN